MSLLGAYLLIKALQSPSKEERAEMMQELIYGNQPKFAKHVDKCRKTNSGQHCEKCKKLGGILMMDFLKRYVDDVLDSPSTTTRPFTRYKAELDAKRERLAAIEKAPTDNDFEEFAQRVWSEVGVEIGDDLDFRIVRSRGDVGRPEYLLHLGDARKYVMPILVDSELEDWRSAVPWISNNTKIENLWKERTLSFSAVGFMGGRFGRSDELFTDKPGVSYYEHFIEAGLSHLIVRVHKDDGGIDAYRVENESVFAEGARNPVLIDWEEVADEFLLNHKELETELMPKPSEQQDTKECPFCAETIKARAIVCRFCDRDLP